MHKPTSDPALARKNLETVYDYHSSGTGFLFSSYVGNYIHYKDHSLGYHWHEDLEFYLVLQGQIELNLSGSILMLNPGDCVFVNGNTLHRSRQIGSNPPALYLITAFHPQMFHNIFGDSVYETCFDTLLPRTNGFRIDQTHPNGARIASLLRELSNASKDDPGYELMCLSRISAIWYETLQYAKETQDMTNTPDLQKSNSTIVKKMLAYIYDHYDQPIEIEDLLAYSSLSRSECFRCFKRYIGTSPIEYINDYRLSQSAHLLTSTDMSIMEICLACGFSSSSYFGKLFKKRYGLSPLAFRKAPHA